MLTGIRLQAHPTSQQKLVLSQWMGCARFIWNAKCDEERYLLTYARKYLPVGTYPKPDQKIAQYKSDDLSPWLSACPSQVLRNSASNWYSTKMKAIKGECGHPRRKNKSSGGSIHLTREVFRFDKCADGVTRLLIGTKRNNIGYLSVKFHRKDFTEPASIRVKKKNGQYWVSFCYEDGVDDSTLATQQEDLDFLRECPPQYLETHTCGVDRGVKRPVQFGKEFFDFTEAQKRKKLGRQRYIKKQQRRMARQQKGSRRRERTKHRVARAHQKIANIRLDFCHKTSHVMVVKSSAKVIIFEDLKTKGMTKKPKAKSDGKGGWERNHAKAKAVLNRSILDKGWHKLEEFTKYKARRAGKSFFKIPAHHTSQECADCGHIHPDNRKSQELFFCESCGHTDNADHNAAEVIKKRAVKLILDPGTGLSKRGVLTPSLDTGRGAKVRRGKRKATHAVAIESSSSGKRQKRRESSQELVPEASPL